MNSFTVILIIMGGALATYCTRFPFLLYTGSKQIPPWLEKYMSFIAPAVLTALIVPMIFVRQDKIEFTITNDYLWAAIISGFTAYFFKNIFATVITGILTVSLFVYLS